MRVIETGIPAVFVVEPIIFEDERGFFMETWQRQKFAELGIETEFVQDNHSRSTRGTIRGLHYQVNKVQGKLVRVTVGEVFDVAVDLRSKSPTFGEWVGVYLNAINNRMLWVPPGFAHGFCVTADVAEVQYKCTEYYAPTCERTIIWDDQDLAIDWPMENAPVVSLKDQTGSPFSKAEWFD